jgi:NADPH:quinone reductase-like Zn-dependent oxidoreductase
MKALTYHGPHHVSVDTMPDPALEAADDIILRVTATAICGSDLHLYRGKIPARTMVIFSAMNLWGKWWKPVPRSPRSAKATGWLSRLSSPAETASLSLAAVCRLRKHQ